MIQESKFLGGDMEHTHLVKGLDFALLQKVRSEITVKEQEQELEMEKIVEETKEEKIEKPKTDELEFKSIMGKNIHRLITNYRSRHVERNDLFAPGRMAYVIDLVDDENAESDIPTTLVRSKADVPVTAGDEQTLTTNDIVINKLSQILSYLRQGGRGKKNKKRDKDKPLFKPQENKQLEDDSIYENIGDYKPSRRREGASSSKSGENSKKLRDYFDKPSEHEEREAGQINCKLFFLYIFTYIF